jgi:ribulose-phosphate 3-epimerase
MRYLILPSLLSADVLHLDDEISAIIEAGADMLHLDIMDNHYVPNLSFGPDVCKAIHQRFETLSIDVHLMASPVDELILSFAAAGAKRISIHPEASTHLDRSLQLIKDQGCLAGLVLNPSTPLDCIQWCIHRLDFILLMMVNPGFGGQSLMTELIKKIEYTAHHYPELPICVDGGVNPKNIPALAFAGASQFVVGSALFHSKDYAKTINSLRTGGA